MLIDKKFYGEFVDPIQMNMISYEIIDPIYFIFRGSV